MSSETALAGLFRSWLPESLLVPFGVLLALAWAIGCFLCLAFVVDAGVRGNIALLCDLYQCSLFELRIRWSRYALVLTAASAASGELFQFVCLVSQQSDGLALAAGHICGTVFWAYGILPVLLRRQVTQTAKKTSDSCSGHSIDALVWHVVYSPIKLYAWNSAGAVIGATFVLLLYGVVSRNPSSTNGDVLLWAVLCFAWAAALCVWAVGLTRQVAASSGAYSDDADGNSAWGGIELAPDAIERNVRKAASAGVNGNDVAARAVVGIDGPPVQSYTFLTLVNTQYDDHGDFLQRPSVRMHLDRKSSGAGRLHGQWRMSSVDEHAGWKQQQVANGRSDLATALLDETNDDGDGSSGGDGECDGDMPVSVHDGKEFNSPQSPRMDGVLHEAAWTAGDSSRSEPETPAAVSVGPAVREWRQRRARRHLWLTGRPVDDPGWVTDGCEGAAVRLLGAFAPPPDPLRWRHWTAVLQPLLGPALLLALIRAKWPQVGDASPKAWIGIMVAVACIALAGIAAVLARTRDARPLQRPTRVAVAVWSLTVTVAFGAACASEASAALATVSAFTQMPPLVLGFVLAAWFTAALPTVGNLASAAAMTTARAHTQWPAPPAVGVVDSPATVAICVLGAAAPVTAAAILRLGTNGKMLRFSEAAKRNCTLLWAVVIAAVIVSVCTALARLAWAFREKSRR